MDSAKNAPHLSFGIENLSTSSSWSAYLTPAWHSPAPQSQDLRVCKTKNGPGVKQSETHRMQRVAKQARCEMKQKKIIGCREWQNKPGVKLCQKSWNTASEMTKPYWYNIVWKYKFFLKILDQCDLQCMRPSTINIDTFYGKWREN